MFATVVSRNGEKQGEFFGGVEFVFGVKGRSHVGDALKAIGHSFRTEILGKNLSDDVAGLEYGESNPLIQTVFEERRNFEKQPRLSSIDPSESSKKLLEKIREVPNGKHWMVPELTDEIGVFKMFADKTTLNGVLDRMIGTASALDFQVDREKTGETYLPGYNDRS